MKLAATSSLLVAAVACAVIGVRAPASATGTVLIQQRSGAIKIYKKAYIRIKDYAMAITSSDGNGTLVIGKAACTKVGELIRCFPYDATLEQYGDSYHVALTSGTVWLNPTKTKQPLSNSSTLLPPRGVLMSVRTKAGTYVSLTGTVDEVQK